MSDSPLFSKAAADRILKRAAEIEGSEDFRPLTLQELRSIAREAGFGAGAVERAIAEAGLDRSVTVRPEPVQKSGLLITHLSTVRGVPMEIDSEQLMRAVRLFQPYRDGPAHVNLEEDQVSWRDRKGLRFTVTSSAGVTEIRVLASRFIVRRRKWMRWVKTAADRLEVLVSLVAAGGHTAEPRLPDHPNDTCQEVRR
ncbi:MAG TPA: hypothetical protein VE173_16695 [Longimicrobiales bacterium]|nr:hypothetical protein [Longimicrobiales bacterium]